MQLRVVPPLLRQWLPHLRADHRRPIGIPKHAPYGSAGNLGPDCRPDRRPDRNPCERWAHHDAIRRPDRYSSERWTHRCADGRTDRRPIRRASELGPDRAADRAADRDPGQLYSDRRSDRRADVILTDGQPFRTADSGPHGADRRAEQAADDVPDRESHPIRRRRDLLGQLRWSRGRRRVLLRQPLPAAEQ